MENLDEGEVKEAGSCRTFASQTGGPSWELPIESAMLLPRVWLKQNKNSISASERSQIEKPINAWAIHTPSLLPFSYYGLLLNIKVTCAYVKLI